MSVDRRTELKPFLNNLAAHDIEKRNTALLTNIAAHDSTFLVDKKL